MTATDLPDTDFVLLSADDASSTLSKPFSRASGKDLKNRDNGNKDRDVAVLLWFDGNATDFRDKFADAWKGGWRRFILIAPEGYSRLWKILPSELQPIFAEVLNPCPRFPGDLMKKSFWNGDARGPSYGILIEDYLAATRIFELLSQFSHGGKNDVTNQFLAPARLLLEAKVGIDDCIAEWRKLWLGNDSSSATSFKKLVVDRLADDDFNTSVGKALQAASESITRWLDKSPSEKNIKPGQLESLMLLLTRIRQIANGAAYSQASGADGSVVKSIKPTQSTEETYRILVVDDHAASWRPVFESLATALQGKGLLVSVTFVTRFSDNNKHLLNAETGSNIQFSEYDLLILDVLLGPKKGTDVLRELRKDFPQLPVLLWTTSRSEDLAASASLANGVILKKTIGWEDFVKAVSTWLPQGRSRRFHTLPNPYFNHRITNPKYRALISKATDWCLKQLDSFHALDGSYFRYFTDHGGRHIVRLFDLLEQALRPFLSSDKVLSEDSKEREFELTAIYLAVVCHELGMFPLKLNGRVEDFSKLGDKYLDDVRSLHAVRGMVLLLMQEETNTEVTNPASSEAGKVSFWSDGAGKELGYEMSLISHPKSRQIMLQHHLAVIVGYHARCLRSLKRKDFLSIPPDKDGSLIERLGKLKSSSVNLDLGGQVFVDALNFLGKKYKRSGSKERLRKLCAIFRFVDALDISESRNPALFLIHSSMRKEIQNREYLKRQICKDVSIVNGNVNVVLCAPMPSRDLVETILSGAAILFSGDKGGGYALPEMDDALLSEPWKGIDSEASVRSSVFAFQKVLDEWLSKAWSVLMGKEESSAWIEHLRDIQVLDPESPSVRISKEGPSIIASIAALSVAGEVIDEYQAIVETGLQYQLRLGRFDWSKGWTDGVPPKISILREGLEQYPAGKRETVNTKDQGSVEIERKWILRKLPKEVSLSTGVSIQQGYLNSCSDSLEVRVRKIGMQHRQTVKSKGGIERTELETKITPSEFSRAIKLAEGRVIEKKRHYVKLKDGTAEVDVYSGSLTGLLVVEVEFASKDKAQVFKIPEWFGPEVTEVAEFKNANLAGTRFEDIKERIKQLSNGKI